MSFSLDVDSLLGTAFSLVNSLFPVFVIPLGISIGIGLLRMVVKAFDSIVRG